MIEYNLIIKPEAELDIADTMQWYKDKQEKLSLRFLEDLDQKLSKVQKNPLHYQIRYKTVRMAILDTFPNAIHFVVENNTIHILAILGTSRDSKLWNRS